MRFINKILNIFLNLNKKFIKRNLKILLFSIMQSQDQKHLESLIDHILKTGFQNLQAYSDEIIKLLSVRVDMPKHLISVISKKLSVK